jgi:hypothetical protein
MFIIMSNWTVDGDAPPWEDIENAQKIGDWDPIRKWQGECPQMGQPNLSCFDSELMQKIDQEFSQTYLTNVRKRTCK